MIQDIGAAEVRDISTFLDIFSDLTVEEQLKLAMIYTDVTREVLINWVIKQHPDVKEKYPEYFI